MLHVVLLLLVLLAINNTQAKLVCYNGVANGTNLELNFLGVQLTFDPAIWVDMEKEDTMDIQYFLRPLPVEDRFNRPYRMNKYKYKTNNLILSPFGTTCLQVDDVDVVNTTKMGYVGYRIQPYQTPLLFVAIVVIAESPLLTSFTYGVACTVCVLNLLMLMLMEVYGCWQNALDIAYEHANYLTVVCACVCSFIQTSLYRRRQQSYRPIAFSFAFGFVFYLTGIVSPQRTFMYYCYFGVFYAIFYKEYVNLVLRMRVYWSNMQFHGYTVR